MLRKLLFELILEKFIEDDYIQIPVIIHIKKSANCHVRHTNVPPLWGSCCLFVKHITGLEVVSTCFQVILKGVFIFYIFFFFGGGGGLEGVVENDDPGQIHW